MLPHKTARGQAALERLKVFEGVPPPFDKQKRMVVPRALRTVRLAPGRNFCRLGDVSALFGWKYSDVVSRLEEKRKARSKAFHLRKLALLRLRAKAAAAANAETNVVAAAVKLASA